MAVKLYIKKNNIIFLRLQTINYICSEIEMLSVLFRTKKQMGDVSEERKRGYSKPWSLSSHRKTAFPILCSAPQCSAPPPPPHTHGLCWCKKAAPFPSPVMLHRQLPPQGQHTCFHHVQSSYLTFQDYSYFVMIAN